MHELDIYKNGNYRISNCGKMNTQTKCKIISVKWAVRIILNTNKLIEDLKAWQSTWTKFFIEDSELSEF